MPILLGLAVLCALFGWIMKEHRETLTLAAVTCLIIAVTAGSWGVIFPVVKAH